MISLISANSREAIFTLPFNMLITIPAILIYCFEDFTICDKVYYCLIALLFLIAGLSLLITTIILFDEKGKGTLAPWYPTKKLVIAGPYQYVRNPMISGVIFILIAESLVFSALSIFIQAVIFFTINTIYFVLKEEADLEKRFGQSYKDYKSQVPMWIPRLTPYKSESNS